ncbi:MAG: hypothetical protein D6796_13255 [Caldilineae bacterium]|nr:MAG: hypothetical protein D6796_13255 [Caldilineae bacterium]
MASRYRPSRPAARRKPVWLYANIAFAMLLIVAGAATLVWAGRQSPGDGGAAGAPVRPAPDFTLVTLEGETVHLRDYRGQVVLVNFWASWCPPCVAELPAIHAFYQAHRQEGFVVLAVNAEEGAATVQNFVQREGFTFPVLLDAHGGVMNRYGVRALPTTFIVDRQGNIRYVHRGEISPQTLTEVVGPLL